ncbi:MAG: head decoration protein [Asticcacaulis sp.]|nr:head decoration protein [Asticcacaulis sp.]
MQVIKTTSPKTEGHLIRHEYNQQFTRGVNVTGLAGSGSARVFAMLAVLGVIAVGARSVAAAKTGTGDGAITGATAAANTKLGVWVATCIEPVSAGGVFALEDPDGVNMGIITVGSAFSIGGLAGTIADGATDWAAGAQVKYTVTASDDAEKYVPVDASATDGSQIAAAICLCEATAPDGEDVTLDMVLDRGPAVVVRDELVWPDSTTDAQKAVWVAQLEARSILARN